MILNNNIPGVSLQAAIVQLEMLWLRESFLSVIIVCVGMVEYYSSAWDPS